MTTTPPTSLDPATPWQALRRPGFLRSSWPWRSLLHVISTLPVAVALALPVWLLLLPLMMALILTVDSANAGHPPDTSDIISLLLAGAALICAFGPLLALPTGILERWRLRLIHPRLASGHRVPRPGLWPWLRTRYTEAATWRELAYLLLLCGVLSPVIYATLALIISFGVSMVAAPVLVIHEGSIAMALWNLDDPVQALPFVPIGLSLLAVVPHTATFLAGLHASLGRALLSGRDAEQLRAELVEVTRSRARLVDAFEAERRRIERDLHDGAQQRLVALAMQLGLARMDAEPGSPLEQTLASVHDQAKTLIGEMRELIHGIHPQLLTDRGLPAALEELGDRAGTPVRVSNDLPHRLPRHVEATAYFCAAEALTNIAKHAEASQAWVDARLEGELLILEVTDDGRGGAEASAGGGLTGLADRVSVMDGRMLLSSPSGGPTRLRVEIPWSSSPRFE